MHTFATHGSSVSSTLPEGALCVWTRGSRQASSVASLRWGAPPEVLGGRTRIELCGRLTVELQGRPLHARLPGRQGRMLFAYLAASRARPISRDELMGALWPTTAPVAPGPALSTLLTRLRHALGEGVLEGRSELWLNLPADASVDLEVMQACAAQAERALACNDPRRALEAGATALVLTQQRLLPEFAEPWVEERRREIDERGVAMLEICARAGLMLGGHELGAAERAARALVRRNPYRESGYALLMEIQAARFDVAEALRVYDAVRVLLRDELGVLPSPALVKLSERLLGLEEPSPGPGDAMFSQGHGTRAAMPAPQPARQKQSRLARRSDGTELGRGASAVGTHG